MNVTGRFLQATMIVGFAFCSSAVAQTLPKCSDNKVQYAAFDANYAKRITLEVATNTQVAARESEKHYSPQRTTWQVKSYCLAECGGDASIQRISSSTCKNASLPTKRWPNTGI